MRKEIVIYGILAASPNIVVSILSEVFNLSGKSSYLLQLAGMLLMIPFLYRGMKACAKPGYWNAVGMVLFIAVFAGVAYALYGLIDIIFFNPEIMEKSTAHALDSQGAKLTPEKLALLNRILRVAMYPFMALWECVFQMLPALFTAPILAIFNQRKPEMDTIVVSDS